MSSTALTQAIRSHNAARSVLSFVLPVRCAVCAQPTTKGASLCAVCTCILDRPLDGEVEHSIASVCPSSVLDAVHALWVFEKSGPIQHVHRAIKYGNKPYLGTPLGHLMAAEVMRKGWLIDTVVPVPLHKVRYFSRGYNQVSEMARGAAKRLGARYNPAGLQRLHATRTQTSLSADERARNVKGVLAAPPEVLVGARVLIVDDVITSGATIAAAASAVKSVGAAHVSACAMGFARR